MTDLRRFELEQQQTLPETNPQTQYELNSIDVAQPQIETLSKEATLIPMNSMNMTQLDHMVAYGRAVIGVTTDRIKDYKDNLHPTVSANQATIAVGSAATLLIGTIAGTAAAKVRERSESPTVTTTEVVRKQASPKPEVWLTRQFSDLDNALQKKFFRETGKKEPIACYPGMCSSRNPDVRVSYRKSLDGGYVLSWRYNKRRMSLHAVREELNDTRVRFTRNPKEKYKNGSSVINKMEVAESGNTVSKIGSTSGVILYFKNKRK